MHIFYWFIIIALLSLTINLITLYHMNKRKNIHFTPIVSVFCISLVTAVLLFVACKAHGTQIISQSFAASFPIDSASYQTQVHETDISYSFYTTDGIRFHFSSHELLSDTVPEEPNYLEMYDCKTRTGFPFCYLSEGEALGYILIQN